MEQAGSTQTFDPTLKANDPAAIDRMIDIAAGVADADVVEAEQRANNRYPYQSLIGLIQVDENGEASDPLVLRARNIAAGGICVISRKMLAPGSGGVLQLVRSNGRRALVGVRVRHCRYVGDMQHETGLQFAPLPGGISAEMFLDEKHRMPLFDPLLRENLTDEIRAAG